MGANRFTVLIRIAEWCARRYRAGSGHAHMLGDDRTAAHFDYLAGYYDWRAEQLGQVKQGRRERIPTFREWTERASRQARSQSTLF